MRGRTKVKLDSDTRLGIFGLVAFESKRTEKPKWAQIGTVKRNKQGYLDLSFDLLPRNLKKIQIRPLKPSKPGGSFY